MTEKLRGFAGFAAGKQPTTTIPNLFFSDLLPILDDLAELVSRSTRGDQLRR